MTRRLPASTLILTACFLVLVLLTWQRGATGWAAHPGAAPETVPPPPVPFEENRLEIDFGRVRQGQTLILSIDVPGSAAPPVKARFGKQIVPFYPDTRPGQYLALMPMEVDQPVGTFEIDVLEAGGQTLARGRVVVQPGGFARQNIRVSKQTQGLSPMPGEMEAIGALKNALTSQRFWQRPFVSPTPDCLNGRFGVKRYHNGVYSGNYHKGVDLRAPLGRPVLATAGGTVEIAKMFRLHGGTVGLDHGQGVASIYIHLSRLGVQPGQRVQAGSVIGWVGATGFANGPHLHWGLYVHGLPVNPEQWTPPVKACL